MLGPTGMLTQLLAHFTMGIKAMVCPHDTSLPFLMYCIYKAPKGYPVQFGIVAIR